jgi:hypothetical protein
MVVEAHVTTPKTVFLDLASMLAVPVLLLRCTQLHLHLMCYRSSYLLMCDGLMGRHWTITGPRQVLCVSLQQVLYITIAQHSTESHISTELI